MKFISLVILIFFFIYSFRNFSIVKYKNVSAYNLIYEKNQIGEEQVIFNFQGQLQAFY